ncbi:14481_t:CDS:1, partial [Gigaspora rosea]
PTAKIGMDRTRGLKATYNDWEIVTSGVNHDKWDYYYMGDNIARFRTGIPRQEFENQWEIMNMEGFCIKIEQKLKLNINLIK